MIKNVEKNSPSLCCITFKEEIAISTADRIKNIRNLTTLSQAKFSNRYQIPTRTLENWERGIRKPPEYVINLLEKLVTYEFFT